MEGHLVEGNGHWTGNKKAHKGRDKKHHLEEGNDPYIIGKLKANEK